MLVNVLTGALASLVLAAPVAAQLDRFHLNGLPPPPPEESRSHRKSDYHAIHGIFHQLIDHKNPELGTFPQHYWYNTEYYKGPGSPIVLNAPGEDEANTYFATNASLPGMFAQTNGGAVIVIEHRYWGDSSPYGELTTTNLQHLNLDNSIQDLIYFAQNVELPFDVNGTTKPAEAPWILTGCSYSGALAAWTQALAPGTFWAYHCSSAVVQAISAFWQYNEPIMQAMPTNCTVDMQKAIRHIDGVLSNGTSEQKHALKEEFGLESLIHDDDFAQVLIMGLQQWQSTMFYPGKKPNGLYQFCDYIENIFPGAGDSEGTYSAVPGPEGVGTEAALVGFARWSKEIYLDKPCIPFGYWEDNNTLECLDMNNQDNPMYKDLTVRNPVNRQWTWMTCNEPFEWWQVSGPEDTTGLVSQFLTTDYLRMQCKNYFPQEGDNTFGLAAGRTVEQLNEKTSGWFNTNTTRLMWVNGEYDPWRPATVSADRRPGGPLRYFPEAPVWVIPGAAHCNDLIMFNAEVNPEVRKIVDEILTMMGKWVDAFYFEKGKS